MSHIHPTDASLPNFQQIFNNALKAYEKKTKKDLLAHPLAAQLQACDSPTAVLAVLQQQVHELNQSRNGDDKLTKWLDPTINVLYSFSSALGEGVGLVFSPAKVIFAGVGVLLLAAKDLPASQETLVDIFERIENFFRRLETYVEVAPTPEMMDMIVKIMVEVLSILAIATKEIKQGRTKKYLKKLMGRTDLENALKGLDRLTHDEARMATAQVLKATYNVDAGVREVADQVVVVDDRVVSVDRRVQGVDERVANVDERVKAVDDKVAEVFDDGKEVKVATQRMANDMDQIKQNQLRENLRRWLSPPDPSTNHNIACGTHRKGTATWFFQGSIFTDWKATGGSLLWIHGKPGSGKTVLCSSVIREIQSMCEAGHASFAYFYFDFRDTHKQHWRDIVPSLLTQLSSRSGPRCDLLSSLYSTHDSGAQQPSDDVLTHCLKEMLTLSDQHPIYLIMDAIDECPDSSGIPSPRERVLDLVKSLVEFRLPNLHICVTSRPEIDIRNVVEPLTSRRVSLHDQTGQKKDIRDYVRSVVYSDSEPIMRRWRAEDKDLVIETLAERADGMFRWVYCQLETLRHCLPPSVRRTLEELPESLDETYERILKEIKKPNRDHARRLLQCLVVAVRPLRVEELAEVLALDFDDTEGIPKLNTNWRWDDQEQALLSPCSSLIALVNSGGSRVVQFSHFSVKEFLTSPRLATPSRDVSHYHITFEPAHTVLAQACMGVLLQLEDQVQGGDTIPLARYAAEYWVHHAQFKDVSTHLRKGMDDLFDPDKPHFALWLKVYDIDTEPRGRSTFYMFTPLRKSDATPLYYAALCGFHELAKSLIVKYPGHVNADGGYFVRPLLAALAGEHFLTAQLLRDNGADPNTQGYEDKTPLHSATYYGRSEIVKKLLEYGADANARDVYGETPLSLASEGVNLKDSYAIRLLLQHGVDVNTRRKDGFTPLHQALNWGALKVVRLLLDHGADAELKDNEGRTPLQVASEKHRDDVTRLISEYSAK